MPPELTATARELADELGTTINDALIQLAEQGAAIFESRQEVARLAAERRAAVMSFEPIDPEAELPSPEEVEEAILSAREE